MLISDVAVAVRVAAASPRPRGVSRICDDAAPRRPDDDVLEAVHHAVPKAQGGMRVQGRVVAEALTCRLGSGIAQFAVPDGMVAASVELEDVGAIGRLDDLGTLAVENPHVVVRAV